MALSYPARSLARLSTRTMRAASSSSTSTKVAAMWVQPRARAAARVPLPASTSLARPVWEPRFTTTGRYWEFFASDSCSSSSACVRAFL